MPAAVCKVPEASDGEAPPICYSCAGDLSDVALKCKHCQIFIHLRCSELPEYLLLRLAATQNSYACAKCVKEKELGNDDEKIETESTKIKETIAKEASLIEAANRDAGDDTVGDTIELNHRPSDATNLGGNRPPAQSLNDNTNSTPLQGNRNPPICKYYARRECKHGRNGKSCAFSHPKICPNFSKNGDRRGGCSKGRNCKDYHPKVCYESLQIKECSRRKCRFYHLNGTKSTYNEEESLPISPRSTSRENRNSYQGPPRGILQRNSQVFARGSNSQQEDTNNDFDFNRSDRASTNFLLMEKKIERLETMLGAILQSVRPPNLAGRLQDH